MSSTSRYTARTAKRDPGGSRPTARDLVALLFVARARAASSQHVSQFLCLSPAMTRRRLRTLKNLGCLSCEVLSPDLPNWYTLTGKGRELLVQTFGEAAEQYAVPRGLPRNLDHHAAVIQLLAQVLAAGNRLRRGRVAQVVLDWELRAELGVGDAEGVQVPDALVVVDGRDGHRRVVCAEVDLGTIAPRLVAARLEAYAQARTAGHRLRRCGDWRVLTIVPTVRRRNCLALAAHALALPEDFLYYAVAEALTDRNVFTSEPWLTERRAADGSSLLVAESPFVGVLADRSDGRVHDRSDGRAPCGHALDPESGCIQLLLREDAERDFASAPPEPTP